MALCEMFRFLVRTIGFVFLAGGFAALVLDGARSIAASILIATPFGESCYRMFPRSFPLLQPAVERHLHPLVWDPFLLSVFLLPTFLVFGLLGMLLLWLAQRRQETLDRVSRA
jgi:hypothetical protein